MNYSITALENALLELIRTTVPQAVTVESYAGQLEGNPEDLAKRWQEIIRRWPAVFVAYGGGAADMELDEFGGIYGRKVRFDLMVCCRSLRGEAGAYAILEALRDLVQKKLLPGLYPLEFISEEALSIFPDSVIYRAVYGFSLEDQAAEEES